VVSQLFLERNGVRLAGLDFGGLALACCCCMDWLVMLAKGRDGGVADRTLPGVRDRRTRATNLGSSDEHGFDLEMAFDRARQDLVPGDESCSKPLGESDVCRVVCGEAASKA
jgi:hypothetical protein